MFTLCKLNHCIVIALVSNNVFCVKMALFTIYIADRNNMDLLQQYIEELNPSQRQAVEFNIRPRQRNRSAIVLAAAGSGKTKTLTLRIANLLCNTEHVKAENILAVTFTNKAANEMRERLSKLFPNDLPPEHPNFKISQGIPNIWVGTFHSICFRILRRCAKRYPVGALRLRESFSIIDSDEQVNIYRKIMRDILGPTGHGVLDWEQLDNYRKEKDQDSKEIQKAQLKAFKDCVDIVVKLSDELKESKVRAKDVPTMEAFSDWLSEASKESETKNSRANTSNKNKPPFERYEMRKLTSLYQWANKGTHSHAIWAAKYFKEAYTAYERRCSHQNCADFAELMLATYEVLSNSDLGAQKFYSHLFREILVDEFQDTNDLQYDIIRLLGKEHGNLFVVGDDDQSIYGFRGARPENFRKLQENKQFNTTLIKIEHNYRSSGHILSLANTIIEYNNDRMGKTMLPTRNSGAQVEYHAFPSYYAESLFIVEEIKKIQKAKGLRSDPNGVAILYRTHMQSQSLEQHLLSNKIPYKIHGGLRFFEREEVKHGLAYFKILQNLMFHSNEERHFIENDLLRIINVPSRSVGETTLERLLNFITEQQLTILDGLELALDMKYSNQGLSFEGAPILLARTMFEPEQHEQAKANVFKQKAALNNVAKFGAWLHMMDDAVNDFIKLPLLNKHNFNEVNEQQIQFMERLEKNINEAVIDLRFASLIIERVGKRLPEFFKEMNNIHQLYIKNEEQIVHHTAVCVDFLMFAAIELSGLGTEYRCQIEETKDPDDQEKLTTKLDNLYAMLPSVSELIKSKNIELPLDDIATLNLDLPNNWETALKMCIKETIQEYFALSTLDSNIVEAETKANGKDFPVILMTIHASKGLEFDNVFVCGMTEGFLPFNKAIEQEANGNTKGIEEERRLAYVAITRARHHLWLTHAIKTQRYDGMEESRFIKEGKDATFEKKPTLISNRDRLQNRSTQWYP